jgi:hypothetical protein
MSPKLSGDRCRCNSCGLYFRSTSAFDDHRAGKPEVRRCRTADELIRKGYGPNAAGFWRLPRMSL